jgi:hypothetical protein
MKNYIEYDKEDLIVLYNLEQIYFYIENKVRPICAPKQHPITKRVGFTFSKKETNALFTRWLNRDR